MLERSARGLVFGALLLGACGQSFEEGMKVICEAPQRCCGGIKDPAAKAKRLADWTKEELTNDDARKFLAEAAARPTEERFRALRGAIKKAKIPEASCPMLKSWTPTPPKPDQGSVLPMPDLDAASIAQTLKQNATMTRFCYEMELARHPKLEGTVTVHFKIGHLGHVIEATAEGMNNEILEQCLVRTVKSLPFPAPKDDQPVSVDYPFVFSRTNMPQPPPQPPPTPQPATPTLAK